jgi:hypothetical protein
MYAPTHSPSAAEDRLPEAASGRRSAAEQSRHEERSRMWLRATLDLAMMAGVGVLVWLAVVWSMT